MRKLLITALVLVSGACHAEWSAVGFIDGKPVIGIDYSRSFVHTDGKPVVWWKEFIPGLTVKDRPQNHPVHVYRTKVDCQTRMVQNDYALNVEAKSFYDNNPSQYTSAWTGPGTWYVADMNSSHEFILNLFCKK